MEITNKHYKFATETVSQVNSWETASGDTIIQICTQNDSYTGFEGDWKKAGINLADYVSGQLVIDIVYVEWTSAAGKTYKNFKKVRVHHV